MTVREPPNLICQVSGVFLFVTAEFLKFYKTVVAECSPSTARAPGMSYRVEETLVLGRGVSNFLHIRRRQLYRTFKPVVKVQELINMLQMGCISSP